MRTYGPALLGILLLVGQVPAQPPQGKTIEDVWEAAYLGKARVGYFRTKVEEVERADTKVLRTTKHIELTMKRFNSPVRLQAEIGTEEKLDGKVTAVFMKQAQDTGALKLTGTVVGDGLHIKVDGTRIDKTIPWNNQVLGLYRQEHLFKERKIGADDRFTFMSFEPTITSVVTIRGRVDKEEEVETLQGRKRLLRVEVTPDKVVAQNGSVQLPSMVVWLDKDYTPIRRQMELPGMGTVTSYRTTQKEAQEEIIPGQIPDINLGTLIPLNRTIFMPHDTCYVVYRITVKGDDDPGTAFAQDARQEVKNLKGHTFELHVQAVRSPQKVGAPKAQAKEEFLKSCYYVNSDDNRVRELARQAVGDATDPLEKARRIESWVHYNMKHDNKVPFAPADQVAQSLRGDCRQHAILTAAMCRAVGVPSATAVGLVYGAPGGKPVMAFHMWTEVWVQGQWLAIDATLGAGSIGAAHIKIARHSWCDTQSMTPMLSVARILGKIEIKVAKVDWTP